MPSDGRVITIGNVLRSDVFGFVVASRIPEPEVPTFGTFVSAPIQQGHAEVVGLVHNINLQDDPFLRSLAVSITPGDPRSEEIIRDQRENRMIPVEIAVVSVAYRLTKSTSYAYGLPPQPPMVLNTISVCSDAEVKAITASPDFLRTLLNNSDVPSDELIPVVLATAARLRPKSQDALLIACGRYLARALGRDPVRLERLLARIGRA